MYHARYGSLTTPGASAFTEDPHSYFERMEEVGRMGKCLIAAGWRIHFDEDTSAGDAYWTLTKEVASREQAEAELRELLGVDFYAPSLG